MVSFSPYFCILLEMVESQGFSSCCHGEDDHAAFTEATTSSRFPRVSAVSVCARVRVCYCRGVIVNPAPWQTGDNSFSFGENHTFTSCTDRMQPGELEQRLYIYFTYIYISKLKLQICFRFSLVFVSEMFIKSPKKQKPALRRNMEQ